MRNIVGPNMASPAIVFLAAALCWSAERPQRATVERSSGTRVVSPAVVVTWIVRKESSGLPELDLLVLWRGTPGWFMRGDASGSSGRMRSEGNDNRGLVVEQISFGGIRLDLEFDQRKHTARIQEQELALESANVILVDDVDSAEGPRIARTLRVDPAFPESTARVEVFFRRSPELFEFLRCDARLPDPKSQSMVDAICAQMKAP